MPNSLSKQPGKRYEAGDGRRRRLTEADGPGHKMLGPHKFLDPSRRSLPQPLLGGRRSEERGRLLSEAGSGGGGGGEDDNGIDLGIYFYYRMALGLDPQTTIPPAPHLSGPRGGTEALSSGPNMFSADAVAAMVEFETKTLEVPSWCVPRAAPPRRWSLPRAPPRTRRPLRSGALPHMLRPR